MGAVYAAPRCAEADLASSAGVSQPGATGVRATCHIRAARAQRSVGVAPGAVGPYVLRISSSYSSSVHLDTLRDLCDAGGADAGSGLFQRAVCGDVNVVAEGPPETRVQRRSNCYTPAVPFKGHRHFSRNHLRPPAAARRPALRGGPRPCRVAVSRAPAETAAVPRGRGRRRQDGACRRRPPPRSAPI